MRERVLTKMRVKYVNVSITEELAKKVDDFIEKSKQGHRSRAELISEAIRLRIGLLDNKKNK